MPPLVSILIPCHDAAPWIAATLESALAQTWPRTEVVLVNDGSRDNSLEIAQGYAPRGVTVIDQPNRGASAARNAAWRASRGDYLQFLDADDLLAPDKIDRQMNALLPTAPDSVAACSWAHFRDTPADAVLEPSAAWTDARPVDWLVSSWSEARMMHPGAWLTRRTVADRAGPWNESLSLDDDGEFFGRVLLASAGLRFVPEAMSYYRTHSGSRLSGLKGARGWESSFSACALKQHALLAVENTARTRRACACLYSRFAWEFYPEAGRRVAEAIARCRELDPSVRPPWAGRIYNLAARALGWRAARRIQKLFWRLKA